MISICSHNLGVSFLGGRGYTSSLLFARSSAICRSLPLRFSLNRLAMIASGSSAWVVAIDTAGRIVDSSAGFVVCSLGSATLGMALVVWLSMRSWRLSRRKALLAIKPT